MQLPDRRPDIDYPAQWSYRLIGASEELLRAAARAAVGSREHRLALTNTSRGGRYVSVELELCVADEGERLAIFAALAGHRDVRLVL